ncbi:TIGR00659 family protein [Mesobacillus persicus]|uniref:TIGR00659 family protein n=1 Tax=Mesobacillus persicus TaxID=930146 RepID=A0A1H7Z480_9BACI|nr:LrgB family protein [Mesobacillus persicus]SEM53270.1 TIGR00659 family protein [Mesobacillus persicus]
MNNHTLIFTLISVVLTIIVYMGASKLSRVVRSPFTTPILTTTILMIAILQFSGISFDEYAPAKDWITSLLGPATVALGVPLYKNKDIIKEKLMPAALGLIIGTLATIVSAVWLSKAFHLSETIQAASAVKAVTTPVAIETVMIIGGDPTLAAAFVIASGIFGAVFAPAILTLVKISDPFSRGLSVGTVSHGIGTSQVMAEGPIQGAVSSVAMGTAAIITPVVLPLLYRFL